ncbi:MAG: ABC transporter permease [Clostridiales bacterium]|nr:ABC transporter permease [Clostridiales bacterium]
MYWKLLKNDSKKNFWSNLVLFLMMTLSVMLAVSVSLILTQLFTSISTMYETAKPPHFLQMHKGELNQEELDTFNRSYQGIRHWQTVPMIDVYGDHLIVEGQENYDLSECRLDISLVRQNEGYDLLLDGERKVLEMKPGEIGVPVILLEQYPIKLGDRIILNYGETERSFTAAAYVYDGQMNSTLCSSTRFLISDEDFETLIGKVGETEYLIEAYLEDPSMSAAYQTAYEQHEPILPKDGQAVTYTMIFLLSAMTDLMLAIVLLLVGFLLMVLALLCLKFTILAALEEDIREIGTMKALGISYQGIRRLYLNKIRILMCGGCIVGYFAAWISTELLTKHMEQTFGEQPLLSENLVTALLVCALVYLIILFFARQVLKKIRKVSIMDALVREKGFGKEQKVHDGIHKAERLPLNVLLGVKEAKRGYGMIFSLYFLVSMLILIPDQLVHTMEDERFMTYMGSCVCDVLIEVEKGKGLEERRQAAEELLRSRQAEYSVSKRVRLQAVGVDGKFCGIHIDTGSEAGAGLQYIYGGAPKKERELALSVLMADELGKKTGDMVTILKDGNGYEFRVCGVYQDVTSGGRTAKAKYDFEGAEAEQYGYQVNLTGGQNVDEFIAQCREMLGNGYSIEDMDSFILQTLGGVTGQLKKAVTMIFGIGISLLILIVLLFLKLRIAKEGAMLSAKRAMGIAFRDIYRQELYPVFINGALGIVAGILFTITVGDDMAGLLLNSMGLGIERIQFFVQPLAVCVIIPAVLLLVLTGTVRFSCEQIKKINVASHSND